MASKKQALTYSQKAKLLRTYGFKLKYGVRGATGKKEKAAVTRQWNKVKLYVGNKKQVFKFRKAKGRELTMVKEGLTKEQVTPGGYFQRIPKGAKKVTKFKRKGNTLLFQAEGPKGGRIREEIHRIDPKLLAEDPPRAIYSLAKKRDKVILTVNGFDSSTTLSYSLDALANYVALDLLPKFLDPNVDPAYTRLHGKRRGSLKQKLSQFSDIFHVKIIRYQSRRKKVTKKRKNTKRR